MDNTTDKQLDELYDIIDKLMTEGDWWLLNHLFYSWGSPESTATLDIRLGIATATLAGKSKLPNRKMFLDKCKKLYPDPELWKGLD